MINEDPLISLGKWLRQSNYCFVSPTPATHQRINSRPNTQDAKSVRDVFGWSRPFRPSLLPAQVLHWLEHSNCLERNGGLLRSKVRFSTLDDDLYVHSSYPTQDIEAVFFGPDSYRFSGLIKRALPTTSSAGIHCVVDVGCGTGVGGIVAVRALTVVKPVTAVAAQLILTDINPLALRYARVNAALAGIEANFLEGDLFDGIDEPIDLLVANPPYLLDADERFYRHGGGNLGTGLSARIVIEGLPRLAPGGSMILYTGAPICQSKDTFWDSIAPVLHAANVSHEYAELDPDIFGEELATPAYSQVDRIAAVGLVIRKAPSRSASPGMDGQ